MDLQTFLLEHLDELVDEWVAFARTLPGCSELGVDALRDHAAAMLRAIAADIGTPQSAAEQREKSLGLAERLVVADTRAEEHGIERFNQGLGLEQLVAEFRALRASVVRLWTARRGPATVEMLEQLVRFNEGIDQAIAESLSRFVDELRQRDESEAQRLREAQLALQEADRRKDSFLATLAHELRNPLAPIRQAAMVALGDGAPAARVRWSVEVIDRQAAKMALLLDELLDISRITRGRLELHRRPVDTGDVVRSAVETVAPAIESREQLLRLELPAAPLMLHADPLRLSQVVANLLTNASRYSGRSSLITVVARADGPVVEIVVSDHGIGIEPDQLDAVFEMFAQGQAPRDLRDGGLGVGLALARGLAQLHGGTLVARSAGPGQGAQFVLRLPALEQPAPAAAGAGLAATAPATGASVRVLVVDDNADAADSLAMLLRLQGHEVCTAYGGAEALAAAADFGPRLVLLDLGMPGMDGCELARRLRAQPGGSGLVLVAVSGWGQGTDRERTAAAGIDWHLTKPIAERELEPAFARARGG